MPHVLFNCPLHQAERTPFLAGVNTRLIGLGLRLSDMGPPASQVSFLLGSVPPPMAQHAGGVEHRDILRDVARYLAAVRCPLSPLGVYVGRGNARRLDIQLDITQSLGPWACQRLGTARAVPGRRPDSAAPVAVDEVTGHGAAGGCRRLYVLAGQLWAQATGGPGSPAFGWQPRPWPLSLPAPPGAG